MYVAGSFLEKKSEAGQECEKIIIKIPSAISKKDSKFKIPKKLVKLVKTVSSTLKV